MVVSAFVELVHKGHYAKNIAYFIYVLTLLGRSPFNERHCLDFRSIAIQLIKAPYRSISWKSEFAQRRFQRVGVSETHIYILQFV